MTKRLLPCHPEERGICGLNDERLLCILDDGFLKAQRNDASFLSMTSESYCNSLHAES